MPNARDQRLFELARLLARLPSLLGRAGEQSLALSGASRCAAAGSAFELDEDKMHRLIANVLRGMAERVTINNVARLERALRDLAICCIVAIPTPSQNINDVGGMRVHLLLGTGWQDSFENADTIVFKPDTYRLGI